MFYMKQGYVNTTCCLKKFIDFVFNYVDCGDFNAANNYDAKRWIEMICKPGFSQFFQSLSEILKSISFGG